MANYRTIIILKTDIVDSTPRMAEQTQNEMGMQRKQHRQFINDTALSYGGSIFGEEGDAYWIEFPSVTDAALAAVEMQQSLRVSQTGKSDKQRLAIRIVITLGDVLHQESDNIGMVMSLTARIEKITPSDEIYLSHAAWLAVNKAEVQLSYVGEFNLKGFRDAEKIYRIEQKHRTRILTDQFILFTDARGWTSFVKKESIENIENALLTGDKILNDICESHGGVIRHLVGDSCFMTFTDVQGLFPAMEKLILLWQTMIERYRIGLSVSIHKGDINVLKSYLYGNDVHTSVYLNRLSDVYVSSKTEITILTSEVVKESADQTIWKDKFQKLDEGEILKSLNKNERNVIDEYGAYLFTP